MGYKRILSVQDISCLGQCSMTVVLPILSVCGLETCILPTMVLSTHTGGLGIPHRRDLTADILPTAAHWRQQGISFDGICVGYLGKCEQVQPIVDICNDLLLPEGKLIVDPAMADHGKLYHGIEGEYRNEIKKLCHRADVILPNLTEAYLLAGLPYVEHPTKEKVERLLDNLEQQFGKTILLTGVGFAPEETGFALRSGGVTRFYHRPMVGGSYHGTGICLLRCLPVPIYRGDPPMNLPHLEQNLWRRWQKRRHRNRLTATVQSLNPYYPGWFGKWNKIPQRSTAAVFLQAGRGIRVSYSLRYRWGGHRLWCLQR